MRTAVKIGDQPVGELVAALGSDQPTPAAGSATAVTLAIAAGLVAKCARKAVGRIDDAEATVAQAERWVQRALELADEDAVGFEEVLTAHRQGAPREALARAADPPLEVATLGAEIAAVAADLAGRGKPWLRGDALSAALLAESATRSAATLAGLDLAEARVTDARKSRARWLVSAAGESRSQAEAAVSRGRW